MLKRLSIDNFRGMPRFDADIEAVTAFLGPNSSGKTTVLHAIRLACDLLLRGIESETPARVEQVDGATWVFVTSGTLLGDPSVLLALSDWRALFVDQKVGEGKSFRITLRFDDADPIQEVLVQVACARNEQLKVDVRVRAADAVARVSGLPKKSQHITLQLTDFLRAHAPRAVFIPPFYGTVAVEEYRARSAIDRLLGSGDQSHVVRNLVSGLDVERFERLNSFLADTVGARLTFRTSGDALQSDPALRVTFKDTNGEIELSAAGAGLINLIALYAALARWRDDTGRRQLLFLLDEPEAHLHPRLQAESAARLARVTTKDFGAQFLLATHSVDILNRLSQEGARLLRCDRQAAQTAVPLDSDASLFDDLASWVDLTPYTAINFLASRKVLFVEGKDELELVPRLGELRFRNDPLRLRQFRGWAVVELKGSGNAPVAPLLSKLLRNDAIRASAQHGGFAIMVLLDRDYTRVPGASTETKDGVTHTTVVWSVHSLESLLVAPAVLVTWIRAFLGDLTPIDLATLVADAVEAANQDVGLTNSAVAGLVAGSISASVRAGVNLTAENGRAIKDASTDALARVQSDPWVWQRGKARAQAVLMHVRDRLDDAAKAHFPTDICRLIERTNLNQIGDSTAAIPSELNAILDQMAPR
ncbi:MAG: AAA family ATPase [Myxococcales bacterium]|nr:AAA family ATPase [Myxococcales bacterium]